MIIFKIYNILSIIILPSVNKQINKNVTRSILGSLTHLVRSPVAFFGFPSFYNHIVLFRIRKGNFVSIRVYSCYNISTLPESRHPRSTWKKPFQIIFADGIFSFKPVFYYGQRSECADLLNSYNRSIKKESDGKKCRRILMFPRENLN